jgi:hypothetical protein
MDSHERDETGWWPTPPRQYQAPTHPPPRSKRGRLSGTATHVSQRTEQSKRAPVQVVSFRLESFDQRGNRVGVTGVEWRGKSLHGSVSEGDHVEVTGRLRNGLCRAKKIRNLNTGTLLRGPHKSLLARLVIGWLLLQLVIAGVAVPAHFLTRHSANPGSQTPVNSTATSAQARDGGPTSAGAGNSVVSVAPGTVSNPLTPSVVHLLTRYFEDINDRNFVDYRLLFAEQLRANLDAGQLAAGYRSTVDSNAEITALTAAADGRQAATVTFTSRQDAADGPDGETCTHWTDVFYIQTEGNTSVFGPHPDGYQPTHSAC